jgi:rhodanese-related sulfurtransferase
MALALAIFTVINLTKPTKFINMKNQMKLSSILFLIATFLYACNTSNNVLDVTQFEQKLLDTNIVLIDVRTPQEYTQGHIEGALNIDFYGDNFESEVKAIDQSKTILVYCKSGNRSGKAVSIIAKSNFKNIYDLSGGITNWMASGKPIH